MPKTPPPRKPRNSERRKREYLTEDEVERLIQAARKYCRHSNRDSTLILLMFRHGLRVSEAINLTWDQLDLEAGIFHVHRIKRGSASTQPLTPKEIRALRQLQKQHPGFTHVFISERLAPLSASAVRKMLAIVGREAGLSFPVHPHMLRHATGYKLARDGMDTRAIQVYLGHKSIQHTVRYTDLASDRFKGFFRD